MPTFAGPILADTNALFAGLLEHRWREVSFPTESFELSFRHDLAIHKLVDRDGAFVEGTGRAPMQFTARIPFVNGITPGPNEHWQRPLYPFAWRKFLVAFADKSTGPLQHPELGDIPCKPESFRCVWSAHRRGGVDVEAAWIETDDTDQDILGQALAAPSPLADLDQAAADADQILETPLPAPNLPSLPTFPVTFEDFMRSIRGAIDQTTLLQKRFAGQLDNIQYQAQLLKGSVARANNALYWPLTQVAERMTASSNVVRSTLLTRGRRVGLYRVPKGSTLAQIANTIPAPIGDLVSLNRALVARPVVPRDSVVRYYLAA